MHEKEIIRLDARVERVISSSVFRAVLTNGHQLVAFSEREDVDKTRGVGPGDIVRVMMSPYDMSVGKIVWDSGVKANHES